MAQAISKAAPTAAVKGIRSLDVLRIINLSRLRPTAVRAPGRAAVSQRGRNEILEGCPRPVEFEGYLAGIGEQPAQILGRVQVPAERQSFGLQAEGIQLFLGKF